MEARRVGLHPSREYRKGYQDCLGMMAGILKDSAACGCSPEQTVEWLRGVMRRAKLMPDPRIGEEPADSKPEGE